ncbi:hypothetical protein C4S77_01460 [Apibacter adventoris]|uniref:Glycosyltransferase RgtA/B/C/D-like domain-containing protein n=1 Tax=Apibacter adventoris TaxID=1679466 RepID=A0A2S8AGL6_9FLAO|nr:hypothetical protein C4S77_01460 [Apibacter adventoris]
MLIILIRVNQPFGWRWEGRPFADIFYYVITGGTFIDIFPLTLILTCIFISVSSLFFIKRLSLEYNLLSYLVVLPILCSPLFLENLSFRNDNVTMSLALSLTIISTAIVCRNMFLFVVKLLLFFIALGIYQTSLNVSISLSFLFFIHDYKNNQTQALKILFQSFLIIFLGYILYYIIIIKIYLTYMETPSPYMKLMSQTVSLDKEGMYKILNNFIDFLLYLNNNFKKKILLIVEVGFVVSYIVTLRSLKIGNNILDRVRAFIYMISPIIIFICIPGVLIFTQNFNILPRVLVGSSIFLVYIFYSISLIIKGNWKLLLLLPYIYFFSLVYSYGSSLIIFKNHKEYLITQINHDLYKLGIKNGDKLYILGSPDYPPSVSFFINKHKFTDYFFLANNFNSSKYFSNEFFILHNLKVDMPNLDNKIMPDLEGNIYTVEKLKESSPNVNQGIYSIYKYNDDYVVYFPPGNL